MMLKIVNRHLSPLNKKAAIAFVKANAKLEGAYLSYGDIKNASQLISHRQTADQLVEKVILRNRLRRAV